MCKKDRLTYESHVAKSSEASRAASAESSDTQVTEFDNQMMRHAIEQAKLAADEGEIPVGAVLVYNDEIIAWGRNQSITKLDPSAHAEMLAIKQGTMALGNYRLPGTTLYVTLEPCSMCAGLLVHARIDRLVFGAKDAKTGACGSISNIVQDARLNHQIKLSSGVLTEECSLMLSEFFRLRRAKKKALKKGEC
ncbi:tRNA adenosine(34) deaminase TadA [Glaciecola siphonariae]|uniref:tRNA-specific adenosine deaminase n=1 Tax=Glaciecola siphonariae TaxID=521012 RepID=A0ABV9LU20_9ALTE